MRIMRVAFCLIFCVLVLAACKPHGDSNKASKGQIKAGGELRIPLEYRFADIKGKDLQADGDKPALRSYLNMLSWPIVARSEGSLSLSHGISTPDNGVTWNLNGIISPPDLLPYSWQSFLHGPESPRRQQLRDLVVGAEDVATGKAEEIAGLKTNGDDTLQITLTRPFMEFPKFLSQASIALSRNASAPRQQSHPFDIGDYVDGYSQTFISKRDVPGSVAAERAKVDSVTFIFEPDRHSQFEMYKRGELDTCNLTADDLAVVLTDPELKKQLHTYDTAATLVGFIDLHATPWGNAPFQDKTPLRQAVNWALYRSELAENTGEMFEPWPHFVPKALKQYIDPASLASPLYSLEAETDKAKEGEGLAGHDQASLLPTNMLLSYVDDPFFDQLSTGISENFDEISIRMRPYPCKTEADALQLVKIGSMDIWLKWVYPAYPSPDALFYPTLHSSLAGVGGNYGRSMDKEIDKLIEAAQAEPDEATRNKLYQQLETEVEQRALFLMIGSGKANILINPKLAGYKLTPYDFDASLPAQDFSKLGFTSL